MCSQNLDNSHVYHVCLKRDVLKVMSNTFEKIKSVEIVTEIIVDLN